MSKKVAVLFLVIFAFAAQTVLADFTQTNWKFKKDVTIPAISSGTYVAAKLDQQIAAGSNAFKDIRLIGNTGKEIGYQLVTKNADSQNSFYPSKILNQSSQGGAATFIIDLGSSGLVHDELEILTSSKNFQRQVSVFASDSLLPLGSGGWRLLTNKGYIYNYYDQQGNVNAESGYVQYPKNTSEYLRVVIEPGQGDVQVSGAQVYKYEISSAEDDTYTVPVTSTENATQKDTELTVDMGTSGIPTHSISLHITDSNFNREVQIAGSNDAVNWSSLGQSYIFNVATSLFQGSNTSITYPESLNRYFKITILNEDNAPLSVGTSATVIGTSRFIVFQANPQETYTLYYGNPFASEPNYDINRIFQYIETKNIPLATFGSQTLNAAYKAPPKPTVPFTEAHPYVLNITLILLVIILGSFLYLYIRKVSAPVPPSNTV